MRLPSLLFSVATAYVIYRLGRGIGGREAGLLSAALAWASFSLVEAGANARPYALAVLMETVLLLGFRIATRNGSRWGRLLFIAGGAGLFSAHYVLVLPVGGLAVAYMLFKDLRESYPFRCFTTDVVAQILLVVPWIPHLLALRARSEELSWLGSGDFFVFFESAGALLVLALAGVLAGVSPRREGNARSVVFALWFAILAQVVLVSVLALAGTNLLAGRYLIVIVPPAALLAADGILRVPWRLAILPAVFGVLLVGFFYSAHFLISGSFSRAGKQDWRGAVARLEKLMSGETGAPVLFRAGFVEEEGVLDGANHAVTLAPLRSPGRRFLSWKVVPLTYRWKSSRREKYFEDVVAPLVENVSTFYFLTCRNCYSETTGNYPGELRLWVKRRFLARFAEEDTEAGRGILLVRFSRRMKDRGASNGAKKTWRQ